VNEIQEKGYSRGNTTCIVGSNPFSNVHVHYDVGSQEGGTCLMFDDFCWLDCNIVDLLVIKEIICNFRVFNEKKLYMRSQLFWTLLLLAKSSSYKWKEL
jgi:hypothetical protein